MVARATEILEGAIIRPYTVPSGKSVTKGKAVKHSGADDQVEDTAAVGDNAIGLALEAGSAGDQVRVALFGKGLAKVLVGTGGVTRGDFVKYASDGGTTATVGGGTTKLVLWGQAVESGSAGDFVGCNLSQAGATVGP